MGRKQRRRAPAATRITVLAAALGALALVVAGPAFAPGNDRVDMRVAVGQNETHTNPPVGP